MAENSQGTANNSQEQPAPTQKRGRGKGRPFQKGVSHNRGPGKKFEPGVCPNPAGRPKEPEEYKVAMGRLDGKAIQAMEAIIDDPDHRKHAEVCMYVVDRNHGKASASLDLSNTDGSLNPSPSAAAETMNTEQRAHEVLALLAKAQAKPGPGPDGNSTT